jgi:hypothetical protein
MRRRRSVGCTTRRCSCGDHRYGERPRRWLIYKVLRPRIGQAISRRAQTRRRHIVGEIDLLGVAPRVPERVAQHVPDRIRRVAARIVAELPDLQVRVHEQRRGAQRQRLARPGALAIRPVRFQRRRGRSPETSNARHESVIVRCPFWVDEWRCPNRHLETRGMCYERDIRKARGKRLVARSLRRGGLQHERPVSVTVGVRCRRRREGLGSRIRQW